MLKTIPLKVSQSWQECLSDLVTDPIVLLKTLNLNLSQSSLSHEALKNFPLRVPKPYLARIQANNPKDPLLLQVLPQLAENNHYPGFSNDPLGELTSNPKPGLLHKYHGRALLITTSSCAIHCRYCFRREFPYADNRPSKQQWQQSIDYISKDLSIKEVILSGGDPLVTSDNHLFWLINKIADIPHIKRLRIHTRLPIMIPQRITTHFCQQLAQQRLSTVIVIHSNHAQELDSEVDDACHRLKNIGKVQLLNQSVILKGINDSADVLVTLSERLFSAGVLPYYLHLLDKVNGAGHFDIKQDQAIAIITEMQARLPGYLVPKLAREIAGQPSKTTIH